MEFKKIEQKTIDNIGLNKMKLIIKILDIDENLHIGGSTSLVMSNLLDRKVEDLDFSYYGKDYENVLTKIKKLLNLPTTQNIMGECKDVEIGNTYLTNEDDSCKKFYSTNVKDIKVDIWFYDEEKEPLKMSYNGKVLNICNPLISINAKEKYINGYQKKIFENGVKSLTEKEIKYYTKHLCDYMLIISQHDYMIKIIIPNSLPF